MTPWSAKGVPKGHFGHPRGSQREVQERVPKRDPKREQVSSSIFTLLGSRVRFWAPFGAQLVPEGSPKSTEEPQSRPSEALAR